MRNHYAIMKSLRHWRLETHICEGNWISIGPGDSLWKINVMKFKSGTNICRPDNASKMSAGWYRVFGLELRSQMGTICHVYSNYDTFHVGHTEAFVDENITVHLPIAYVANMVYVVWAHRDCSNHTNQATTAHVTWNLKAFQAVTTPSYLVDSGWLTSQHKI